jgi:hypothetical protein
MRATWMAGGFGKIAEYTANDAEAFVEALDITPGMQVLDVARLRLSANGVESKPRGALFCSTIRFPRAR